MMRYGLSYGWLSARRRLREMTLPAITTATGAFLVVIVFGMSEGISAQSASLGNADEIGAAYCLLCETVEYPESRDWAVFTLREGITF